MTTWSGAVGEWLADYYALTTVVLLAVMAVLCALKQPVRRLAVAWSAVAGLVVLVVLAALPGWPRAHWSERHARAQTGELALEPTPLLPGVRPIVSEEAAPVDADAPPVPRAANEQFLTTSRKILSGGGAAVRALDWAGAARWAFLTAGTSTLVWLAIGAWRTAALRRGTRRAPVWVEDLLGRVVGEGHPRPDLRLSDRLSQPVAVGLLRPAIILPDPLVETSSKGHLEAVLAHEWAHIRHRDLWLIAVSRLLMPILFAHPAYWWLRRRIRDDQEMLADAAAAADRRIEYAEVLLSWAAAAPERPRCALAGSLALWERRSQLKRRILMLLDRDFRVESTCPRRWCLGVRGGTALVVLALSVLTLRPAVVEADPPPAKPADAQGAPRAGQQEDGTMVRVLDPEGKPAAGARVYRSDTTFYSLDHDPRDAVRLARTAADGTFRLSPDDTKAALDRKCQIVVLADGYGPALVDPSVGDGMKELRLVKDDVPIRGRLLDIQGQPVAGASIQVVALLWHPSGALDAWRDALEKERAAYPVQYRLLRSWSSDDLPSLFPAATTDRDGRFTLTGLGRERIASLLISGPKIETRFEFVATRDMPKCKYPDFPRQNQGREVTYFGASFELVAGPGLEIAGSVLDKDTGKPLAGAQVQTTAAFGNPLRFLKTTTDGQGRYRLTGIPPKTSFGDDQDILVSVDVKKGPPYYLPSIEPIGGGRGPGVINRDLLLKRGVLAHGRITDKTTGKPVRANLGYFIMEDNPHLKAYPRYGTIRVGMPFQADEAGEYRIVVMPGRGILGARFGNDTYRLGVGVDKIKDLKMEASGLVRAQPSYLVPKNYNTVVAIDPKPEDESITADIELDRGRTLKGTLVGPDAAPVPGALIMGAEDHFQMWSHQPLPTAEFEVHALGSDTKRGLLFYHEGKKLAGAYVVQPDEQGPVTIKLQPCGTLSGRLVDAGGLPQAGAQMTCDRPFEEGHTRFEHGSLPAPIKTDKDGRFQVSGLVPGLKYTLRLWKGRMIAGEPVKDVIAKAGEVKELGDIKATD